MSKCFLNCNHHPFLLEKLVCLSYYYVADCGGSKSVHTLAILYTSRDQAELIFFSWRQSFVMQLKLVLNFSSLCLGLLNPGIIAIWCYTKLQCLVVLSARMLTGLILYRFCAGNLSCCKFRRVDRASLSSPGWPRTCHVDQPDLKCVVILWQVLRLQV